MTVVPSSTSTAAESLASENSAATSAGSSQETVQPAQNQILLSSKARTETGPWQTSGSCARPTLVGKMLNC